ncbi:MAG: T9SS type A sorting domain-containing protein [Candidatus Marinimicrobia bacterium]|nr:T9SS type A sorting domain-containing protein [Candidatus Neomarinimicrobiota bacterium]MBT4361861.1 T9SS type A sorting domain-containing protein [Candidatus Neomarinimicrobiota bacterium]MBT4714383.1 T9SS type A sorting domain-containing protein [Candidatus Neomarinimicrobiota bacterium]MBT4946084.1 T9SS type A sorting domain-containing protein [Candidatus Neomarinimicrobiota bacterium]MBT5268883.1 T9SS type A sorting domain-containing protein [Candidatus Neomarinimicrobiota bacterium]
MIVALGNNFSSLNCQAWADLGATYPVADDRGSGIWSDFGTGAIPRNAIIDLNGVVRYNSIGYNESAVTDLLDELLIVTGVDEEQEIPKQYGLLSVFPNPFNAETQIQFELPHSGQVTLSIYDSQGRVVRRLLKLHLSAGSHQVTWNTRDDSGVDLPSGVYLATLSHDGGRGTRKLLLLK